MSEYIDADKYEQELHRMMDIVRETGHAPGISGKIVESMRGTFIAGVKAAITQLSVEHKAHTEAVQIQAKAMESTKREVELAKERAPIIAVDFDGTLCENKWPEIGKTRWATVQALIAAQAAGARLILWTNRVGARLAEAIEWCRNRELEFDAVNENLPEIKAAFVTDSRKIYADIYLDDRAAQPSAAVLEALWETARAEMNRTTEGEEV